MRTYGRIAPDPLYPYTKIWVEVDTDVYGFNDNVWLTTLIQTIKLNLGESPFYANYGIPAHPSVVSQIAPDYYMSLIQQQYAQYFTVLIISKQPNARDSDGTPAPYYFVSAITQYGAKLETTVPY